MYAHPTAGGVQRSIKIKTESSHMKVPYLLHYCVSLTLIVHSPPWPHLISDVGLELRVNINSCSCNYSIEQYFVVEGYARQLTGPADRIFVTLGPLRCA